MMPRPGSIRLFQWFLHVWVLLFMITSLPAYQTLWMAPLSPALQAPSLFAPITHAFHGWAAGAAPMGVALVIIGAALQLHRPRWYVALVVWSAYVGLMHLAWLAGSGGQQLIANMLFWNIFLCVGEQAQWRLVPFWIIRCQLLLAYLATAAHKSTGGLWLSGEAIGVVASDPHFGGWVFLQGPLPARISTWLVWLFQCTFPLAVWSRHLRIPWMIAGIMFHLATAWLLGIPEMAFAFIACYPIWLDEDQAARVLKLMRRVRLTGAAR